MARRPPSPPKRLQGVNKLLRVGLSRPDQLGIGRVLLFYWSEFDYYSSNSTRWLSNRRRRHLASYRSFFLIQ